MPKMDIHIYFKGVDEPEVFENMDEFDANKGGKFLYLYADCGAGLEWYILHDSILYFEIEYKEEEEKDDKSIL